MVYSSIHLLHCKFFEVQVAYNVMLQHLLKFVKSLLFFPTLLNGEKELSSLIFQPNSIYKLVFSYFFYFFQ